MPVVTNLFPLPSGGRLSAPVSSTTADDSGCSLVVSAATAALLEPYLRDMPDVELYEKATPFAWTFESDDGGTFDLQLACARCWERPPYVLMVRLRDGNNPARLLAEAAIGTRVEFEELLHKALSTMRELLRAAMKGMVSGSARSLAPIDPPHALPFSSAMRNGRVRRSIHRWQDRLCIDHWAIAQIPQSAGDLLDGQPLAAPVWVDAGRARDLADPHAWPGTSEILCEEIPLHVANPLGRIVSVRLSDDGRSVVDTAPILGGTMHRSYPGAIWLDGDLLMLPETPETGETTIYRLAADGDLTPVSRVAPRLRMADPTLFRHAGLVWLAYTDLDIGTHDNLCLLYAEDIRGPWHPHRCNPVKMDIRSARPAGPIFWHREMIYRPAQDCSETYGGAVSLNRIDLLTPQDFLETTVRRIAPDSRGPLPHGLHTFSVDEARIIIDGKRRRLDLHGLLGKAVRRATKVAKKRKSDV